MEALILSCSTGGGHNAAAAAVKEALIKQGHHAMVLDPYSLSGNGMEDRVGESYVRVAQFTPHLFGMVYGLGEAYRNLPFRSPVYKVQRRVAMRLHAYLQEHTFDAIFTTHVFPGEILAQLKNHGKSLPPCFFIATDYVCTPFSEEAGCDYFVTPAPLLNPDFTRRGIAEGKLLPFGIPVGQIFAHPPTREEAIEKLSLDPRHRYLLLSGGSIGAGSIGTTITVLKTYLESHSLHRLIVICGNNRTLMQHLQHTYGSDPTITLLGHTDCMADYMAASDAYLSKPGGLSSTEAAVSGTPLIHISPIPGCETLNMAFFRETGMSLAVGNDLSALPGALEALEDPSVRAKMRACQAACIPPDAADTLCRFAQSLI